MTLHSLPLFVRLAGRPVILVGEGEAAEAKRRLLDRAGAIVVDEHGRDRPAVRPDADASADTPPIRAYAPTFRPEPVEGRDTNKPPTFHPRPPSAAARTDARLAIVVDDEPAVARLRARGVLVNAVDRPDLCDFTLPAIVDRAPVIVAIGTGGVSAGLAAALRQRLEAILPASLGRLAEALHGARAMLRTRYPNSGDRRRAIGAALAPGAPLDPLADLPADPLAALLQSNRGGGVVRIVLRSPDPDDLTLREARALANADRVTHRPDVPTAILDRARADAIRIACNAPPGDTAPGLCVDVSMA